MEVAGLAVGVAGLAALFGSCKAFLDLIQISQTYSAGFEVLDTKFEAQKLRFQIWGQAVGLTGDLPYDRNLDGEAVRPTVERILNNIRLLFLDTDQLKQKYGLRQMDDSAIRSQAAHIWRESFKQFRQRLSRTQDESRILIRAKWAVVKKDRFEILLRDMKDFIDSLEAISSSLEQLSRRRNILENDIREAPSERSLRILREVTADSGVTVSDHASSRFLLLEDNTISCDDDESVFQAGQATSTHETFVTTLTHQLGENLALHEAVGGAGLIVHSAMPQNQRILSSTIAKASASTSRISSMIGFSEEENAIQKRKFFNIKTGDKDILSSEGAASPSPPSLRRNALKKLLRELKEVFDDSITQVSFKCIDGNVTDLLGIFLGPDNSPYQGGVFFTRWAITEDYPFCPPTVKFLTKVYHPNIDARGRICLDGLAGLFNSAFTILSMQVSILSLLDSPGTEDPLVPEIAQQYVADREEYNSIARHYTKQYATGEMPEIEPLNPESPWWKELQEWTRALNPR